jgi:hypothetical protein
MSKLENVANAVEVKPAKKKSIFSEAFDKEYQERITLATTDVAPRIIDTLEAFGLMNEFGYQLDHGAVLFEYDVLNSLVKVDVGGSACLRVNMTTKKVTVFRKGPWERVFEQLWEARMLGKDTSMNKLTKETKIRDLMGMSKN